jgi:uncharacterized protein YjbI with pentapeptide repeats
MEVLSRADFTGAKLTSLDLSGTTLTYANISGAEAKAVKPSVMRSFASLR